jgi:hypothetical protein
MPFRYSRCECLNRSGKEERSAKKASALGDNLTDVTNVKTYVK